MAEVFAKDHSVHPVREYLTEAAINYDGVLRVTNWLMHYLGAKQSQYTAAAGQKFLIGAVACIFERLQGRHDANPRGRTGHRKIASRPDPRLSPASEDGG